LALLEKNPQMIFTRRKTIFSTFQIRRFLLAVKTTVFVCNILKNYRFISRRVSEQKYAVKQMREKNLAKFKLPCLLAIP